MVRNHTFQSVLDKKEYRYKQPAPDDDLELAKLGWDEYKYRHEFCWNLLSRITLVTVALSIIPYLEEKYSDDATRLVIFTPLIGILFALLGAIRLYRELKLLDKMRSVHREFQNRIIVPKMHPDNKTTFRLEAMIYIILLTLMAIVNFIVLLQNHRI